MIITNARVLTCDAGNRLFKSASVEVRANGTIGSVGPALCPSADGDTIDAGGRLLMPALINCHTHLYSTLARGISIPGRPPRNFPEILKKLWWRLDRALNPDDIYYSALVGAIDSAKCGVGTVVDHHSSPNSCARSLDLIERAVREVGLRAALCYETSDRNGTAGAREGIAENIRFAERTRRYADRDTIAAGFGLHAAFTLSDRTLRQCIEANQSLGAGFHIHISEDRCDTGAVQRLARIGVLDDHTIAAHCLHITGSEMHTLSSRGVNIVHNPESNCNNAVGVAKVVDLVRRRVLVGLGSDGYSPRMWDEFKTAFHLQKLTARDPRVAYAEAYAMAFLNNREIVRKVYGMNIGRIETGAEADLILVDYFPPTPVCAENLFGHLLFGISNASVDTLIVKGRFVVRNKRCVSVNEAEIAEQAARQAKSLWRRFEGSCKS